MKQKTGRKLLSFLLTLAMVVGLMPGMELTAYAAAQYKVIGTATDSPRSLPSDFMEVTLAEATAYGQSYTGTVGWLIIYAKDGNNYKFVCYSPEKPLHNGTQTWDNIIYGESYCYHDPKQVSIIVPYSTNIAVTSVTLTPSTAQTIDVDGTVSFTATVSPNNATDKTVKWSVGGTDAGAVKLYTDEACNNEIGADATSTLTVYAKGISAGSATVTATSNADSEKKASCDVTVGLLTTITATGKEQASYSPEGVATVSFSYTTNGSSSYQNNGSSANWGWWGYGWTATVAPANGYTITKCVFYDDADRTATDSSSPFEVKTTEEDKTPQVNGTPILAYTSKGIKKIEVYGYATPAHTHNFGTSYKLIKTNADKDTITATCSDTENCSLTGGKATMTIVLSNGTATLTGDYAAFGKSDTDIVTQSGSSNFQTASITVGGKTASITYGVNCITYATGLTNGSIKNNAPTGATCGATIDLFDYIQPDTGYKLDALTVKHTDNNTNVTVSGSTFVMPEANVTVSATFKKINSAITLSQPDKGGTVTVKINNADVTAADYGATITLGNAPAAGYTFGSYSVTKTGESSTTVTVSNDTFTMPEYPVTVTGTFTPIDYTVMFSATTNGTVGANKTSGAHVGDEITLTVTPADDYILDTLTVTKEGGDNVTVSNNKFTMPAANVTVSATFKAVAYTVTANGNVATIRDNAATPNEYTATLNISDKSYDGTAATATVTKSVDFPDSKVTVGAVSYAGRDGTTYSSSATAPTDVGKYTASVTVGDKTVNKNFEIKPQEPISYISSITYNPATNTITVTINTITQYVLVTSETKAWANNWYVVKGNVTINGPVTYGSNVKLLLCDGASLTVKGGIKPSGSELAIYGQEGQTGLLEVEGADNGAALDGGTITVNGGKLKLIPGTSGTLFGDSASVTFNNGVNITAKNSSDETVTVETGKTYTGSELNSYKELNAAARAAATVKTAPTAKTGLTANGSAQALVNAGTANGGTMQYALGTSSAATGAYSTTIPTATAAGTYYVWYKAVGSDGDSAAAYVTVTVSSRSTSSSSSSSDSSSSTPSSTTTTTTTTDTTSNPDASTTNGTATVTTTTNRDGSTTEKTTETATKSGEDGSKTEVKAESTTTTKSNTDGTTTAATTATETATTTAADGTKTVTETKTEAKETLDKSGNGTVEAKTTETVKDASGKVTATTVTESKGTVETATDGTKTTTTTNTAVTTAADGTKTTVVTTEKATETTDGNTGKVVSDESGKVVSVEAKVSETAAESAAKSGETVTLPVTVTAAQSAEDATPVAITVPKAAESVKVEIPVEDVKPGTVAVIVHEDGTEEIVKTSTTSEGGVVLALESGASVKVVDNTKTFDDVDDNEWYAGNVAWASSREVMNGVGNNTFAPNEDTNRAMVTQILYNLDNGKASDAVPTFNDVSAGDWYADSVSWAVENGIAQGEGESFGANDAVTREQLAVMLYNYAGKKGYDVSPKGDISRFADNGNTSAWASDAMAWAVGIGIINGARDAAGNTLLDPQGNASRAQVTAMTERFCQKAAK